MIWFLAAYLACGCLFLMWVCHDKHDPCVFTRDWKDMLGLMLLGWVFVAVSVAISVAMHWAARIVDRVRS